MQIQVNTDHNVDGSEALSAHVVNVVEDALRQVSSDITRVEIHLGDESSHNKQGVAAHMRCTMEARLEGHQPLAVTHHAENLHQVIDDTADSLSKLINSTLERLDEYRVTETK